MELEAEVAKLKGSKACIIGSIRGTEVNVEEGANIYASAHVWNATTVNILSLIHI